MKYSLTVQVYMHLRIKVDKYENVCCSLVRRFLLESAVHWSINLDLSNIYILTLRWYWTPHCCDVLPIRVNNKIKYNFM